VIFQILRQLIGAAFLGGTLLALPPAGMDCRQLSEQMEQKLLEQKKLESENEKLEEALKGALQNEMTAQVEKRDASSEQSQATQIYYQLRKTRVQKERELRAITNLQQELCRKCPDNPSCKPGRKPS